jgi:GTP cyclohydrolase I
MNRDRIEELVRQLIIELGEDPEREGLQKTPRRYFEMMRFLCSGYNGSPEETAGDSVFSQKINNMVLLKDIEFYSLCEHHILPFFGRAHVGYIAKGKVLGVSKLARIVDLYSRRLQLQERLTEQIAHGVRDAIGAQGVGVVIEARHFCMMMRGVRKQNSVMVTSSLLGGFMTNASTRAEFLSLIENPVPHI